MAGRRTIYSEELAREICVRLARGESLRSICRDDEMPHLDTILNWAVNLGHPFSAQYARARDIQADVLADEIQDIADDGTNDYVERETKKGTIVLCDHEHIQRSRLRVDTRKWIASKLKPKKYADKIIQDVNLNANDPDEQARRDAIEALKNPDAMKAIETVRKTLEPKGP